MAFPTDLDNFTAKSDGVDYPQAADINELQEGLEAVQAKVGADDSAVASSIDYKLKNTTSGHDHDGSDSKKVIATNLNPTGLTVSQLIRTNSAGTALESSGKTVPTGDIVGTSDSQTLTTKTLTSPVLNTGLSGTAFLDEDNMASNSASKAASQQSIKAYVDSGTVTMTNKTLTTPIISGQPTGTGFDAWATWAPTFTGFTKGSATITAKYTQIGKTVHGSIRVVLAADSSFSGTITISLPVTAKDNNVACMGTIYMEDAGTASYVGWIYKGSSTIMGLFSTAGGVQVSATAPFVWTTNDYFSGTFTYEAAT